MPNYRKISFQVIEHELVNEIFEPFEQVNQVQAQLIIKQTTHTYASGYRNYPNEWEKQHGRLLTNSSSLIKIKNRTDWEMQQIYAIAKRHIDKGTPLDVGCIISEFEEFNRQQSFSGFLPISASIICKGYFFVEYWPQRNVIH